MTAVATHHHAPIYGTNMGLSLFVSIFLHISIFGLAALGIPYIAKDIDVPETIITVELFDVSEIIETTNPDKLNESKEEDTAAPPEKKPIYNKIEKPPELIEPEQPDIQDAVPEPIQEPPPAPDEPVEPEVVPEEPELIKAPPPKPKAKPKPPKRPKKPIKKEAPKKPKEAEKDINSLLKSLTPDEEKPSKTQNQGTGQGNTSQQGNLSKQMTSNDLISLIRGVQPCWNVNAGGRYAESLVVKLRVFVNRDRTVRDAVILDKLRYASDSHYKSAADAARWALLNPKCSTLNVPPEKYDTWKRFIFVFDPSQML